jgi:hypothetical protein
MLDAEPRVAEILLQGDMHHRAARCADRLHQRQPPDRPEQPYIDNAGHALRPRPITAAIVEWSVQRRSPRIEKRQFMILRGVLNVESGTAAISDTLE